MRAVCFLAPAVALVLAVALPASAQQAASQNAAGGTTAAASGSHASAASHDLYFGAALFDQNELRSTGRGSPIYAWEGLAYYGTDYNRVWVNARGETNRDRGGLERAELQLLYSRLVGYFWDIQAGVRHDFRLAPRDGTPPRTYGVVSLQGLALGRAGDPAPARRRLL